MPPLPTAGSAALGLSEDVDPEEATLAFAAADLPAFAEPPTGVVLHDTSEQAMALFDAQVDRYAVLRFNGGRVRFLSKVAVGQWGRVYAVQDLQTFRPFALKVVAAEGCGARGLEAELAALRRLRHPHIVRYFDDFEVTVRSTEFCGIKMELCSRGTLRQLLLQRSSKGKPLSAATVHRYLSQITDAIAYIHQNGALHGDLRPDRVLLTAARDVRLTGFGDSARVLRRRPPGLQLTITGGRRAYAPPEWQDSVQPHRPLTPLETPLPAYDMWGVGCVLSEMATMRLIEGDRLQHHGALAADSAAMQELMEDLTDVHQGRFYALAAGLFAEDPLDRLEAGSLAKELQRIPQRKSWPKILRFLARAARPTLPPTPLEQRRALPAPRRPGEP